MVVISLCMNYILYNMFIVQFTKHKQCNTSTYVANIVSNSSHPFPVSKRGGGSTYVAMYNFHEYKI